MEMCIIEETLCWIEDNARILLTLASRVTCVYVEGCGRSSIATAHYYTDGLIPFVYMPHVDRSIVK